MEIPYYHVDAFTRVPFAGNPAGVCILESWLEDDILQNIAAENNLPETAFVVQKGDHFALRWFTPLVEIDLCGHATLAAAFVLYRIKKNMPELIRFTTMSGELLVKKRENLLWMDFPAREPMPSKMSQDLVEGLGATPDEIYRARDLLAVFATEEQIASLQPDFNTLARLAFFGIIVTAPGNKVDFVSRFFAPAAGINEDPVTGSSHCTLIPYWAKRTGKNSLNARQLSRRGGEIHCEHKKQRVMIGGHAVLYKTGTLFI